MNATTLLPASWICISGPRRETAQRFGCVAFLAALLLFLPAASVAQRVTGDLEGRLVDSLGTGVSDASIIVTGAHVQGPRGGASGEDGFFTLLALPPGIVSVAVSHVNYQFVILENVLIELGRTTSLGELEFRARSGDLPEIIVLGARPLIDLGSTSTGSILRSSEFEYLPVERNYRHIATIVPEANVSFLDDEVNIAGATGRENKYFIDGIDVTDPSFSKTGTNLPYNFIEAIEVMTGGYEAEYRSTLGGLLNVTTRAGSNQVHGSVFGFYTNSTLSATPRGTLLDPAQGGFASYDVGLALGGPLVRDRLWYFGAYNPTFQRRDVDIPALGTHVDERLTHSFAGKLTWRVSPRLNVTLTSTGDPAVRKAIGETPPQAGRPTRLENPDPYLTDHKEGGVNLSASGSLILADGILIDASLSRVMRDEQWEPSTERGRQDTVLIDVETGAWSGGGFGNLSFFRQSTTARSSSTVVAASHQLKAGIEYRNVEQDVDLDIPLAYHRYSDTLYTYSANGTRGRVYNRILSAFAQDTWQINRMLRIQAGVRLDGQWIIASNGRTVHVVEGPLQPRLGFVLTPYDNPTQKLFGSIGRFTQEWSSAVMTTYSGTQYFHRIKYNRDPRVGGIVGDTLETGTGGIPEKSTLRGQHYDELSVGYERLIGRSTVVGIRGVYRTFREAINVGIVGGVLEMGNPGRAILSALPRPQRDYAALVFTVQRRGGDYLNYILSYVLSRNYGNYEGLYDSYNRNIVPNVNFTYSDVVGLKNGTGPLPNDRTHAFKFAGSYRFGFGLVAGTSFSWQTGTPLSEIAGFGWFLQPRGSEGRTPNVWDLNMRLLYPLQTGGSWQTKLLIDIFHIASRRKPIDFVQQHYAIVKPDRTVEGPNSSYGLVNGYQPPMSIRLGLEMAF